jgi:hypothetical protein
MSRTEVWSRSVWFALLQNAKYSWVIYPVLGVPIVETFVQECCNCYEHEKFYAGTVITSDCLIPACELVQFARVFSAKYALPALFKYLCDGNKYCRFGGPRVAHGVGECQESRCLTKLCGKNIAIPALCFRLSDRGRGVRILWAGYRT